jgi:PiT family inorganic phosphate transporter
MQPVDSGPQFWVIVACAVAIAAGTYSGGWRIIKTIGRDITDGIEPGQGFAAEASTTATILASTHLGFALSTTQVASGSVIGTGIGRKGASVRWRTAGRIALGWLITIPASGAVAAIMAIIANAVWWGVIVDVVLAAAAIGTIYLVSRRGTISAKHFSRPEPTAFVRPKRKKKKSRGKR